MANILVVEANKRWQGILRRVLQQEAHAVHVAGTLDEVAENVTRAAEQAAPFDLVVWSSVVGEELSKEDALDFIHRKDTSGKTNITFLTEQGMEIVRLVDHSGRIVDFFNKGEFGDGKRFLQAIRQDLQQDIIKRSRVRLQELRDFTVQIRHPETHQPLGTGILISTDGQILTCADFIQEAIGVHPREALAQQEVDLYFPRRKGREKQSCRAQVKACFPQHDDDVVLLQVTDGSIPRDPEQIAVLGSADDAVGKAFLSYGYWRAESYNPRRLSGTILGDAEQSVEDVNLQADPLQLQLDQANRDMSGAAVLEKERNLVVGLVSETLFPEKSPTEQGIGWAVASDVFTQNPFQIPLREVFPLSAIHRLEADFVNEAKGLIASELQPDLTHAPEVLEEWVGREPLLANLASDWKVPERRMTGLIGFGGEGKSSVARTWVKKLTNGEWHDVLQPQGIFWWSFENQSNADQFFEAAFQYMTGKKAKQEYAGKPPSAKARLLSGMLQGGRFLFILDGVESLQTQEEDLYGAIPDENLSQFLMYFSDPEVKSFCLITSRLPIVDFMNYTTYIPRDVSRLSKEEGCELLQHLGIKGDRESLENIVEAWGGHALTLNLLGAYLLDHCDGEAAQLNNIPAPTQQESYYDKVFHILRTYDNILNDSEKAFLQIFSAFRKPVSSAMFTSHVHEVFHLPADQKDTLSLRKNLSHLTTDDFQKILKHLMTCRLLHQERQARQIVYSLHPLVRTYYKEQLEDKNIGVIQDVHRQIKLYYRSLAAAFSEHPTLEELSPLLEALHHACQEGEYDEAYRMYRDDINQGDTYLIPDVLCAWETNLALMEELFGGDLTGEPKVKEEDKGWVLNEVGFCKMMLGRLHEAADFYRRGIAVKERNEDWKGASVSYENLAEIQMYLGQLDESAKNIRTSLEMARKAEHDAKIREMLTDQAWIHHLRGEMEDADQNFVEAQKLQRELEPEIRYVYKLEGTKYADHLRRQGKSQEARNVTEANLAICEQHDWKDYISRCHRILGELDAESGQQEGARRNLDTALKMIRSIECRDALIEALLARGRWLIHYGDEAEEQIALDHLKEALDYARNEGFRIYEAGIRIALARAYLKDDDQQAARRELQYTIRISTEMGYHWGSVDAENLLQTL